MGMCLSSPHDVGEKRLDDSAFENNKTSIGLPPIQEVDRHPGESCSEISLMEISTNKECRSNQNYGEIGESLSKKPFNKGPPPRGQEAVVVTKPDGSKVGLGQPYKDIVSSRGSSNPGSHSSPATIQFCPSSGPVGPPSGPVDACKKSLIRKMGSGASFGQQSMHVSNSRSGLNRLSGSSSQVKSVRISNLSGGMINAQAVCGNSDDFISQASQRLKNAEKTLSREMPGKNRSSSFCLVSGGKDVSIDECLNQLDAYERQKKEIQEEDLAIRDILKGSSSKNNSRTRY